MFVLEAKVADLGGRRDPRGLDAPRRCAAERGRGTLMLDFGVLPPEINSARMYAGTGSGPMMAAAAAWDVLANGLESVSRGYSSAITRLQGESWSGGASEAMSSAIAPYVAWVATAGAKAEEAASQARAAAAAYETAFAATVPPPLVTANRTQLATLVAHNVFGQYTAEIAATEAQYEQMWAQDAAAMYTYAASSSAATTLSQFGRPPQTTSATAQPAQAAAVAQSTGNAGAGNAQTTLSQLMSSVPQQLQSLASTATANPAQGTGATSLLNVFDAFNTVISTPGSFGDGISRTFTSAGSFGTGLQRVGLQGGTTLPPAIGGAKAAAAGAGAAGLRHVPGPVAAQAGTASALGKLSVPQSWATTNPAATPVAEPVWLSDADIGGGPSWEEVTPATNMWNGAPAAGTGAKSSGVSGSTVNNVLRVGPRKFTMPRPSLGG
jgi:PPE-repeat protein